MEGSLAEVYDHARQAMKGDVGIPLRCMGGAAFLLGGYTDQGEGLKRLAEGKALYSIRCVLLPSLELAA